MVRILLDDLKQLDSKLKKAEEVAESSRVAQAKVLKALEKLEGEINSTRDRQL